MRHSHMGATPRVYGMGAAPRVYGMHHLGRSVLSLSAAQSFNRGSGVRPSSAGIYGNTSSDKFIKDLWTAQVLSLWVTNGSAYGDMGMSGIVRANGHNPENVAPLGLDAQGVATTNLKSILPSAGSSDTAVKGPDGMFGPSAESIIAEWAGTRKLFGKSLSGQATLALTRLANNIKTPSIDAANAKRLAGNPPPPKPVPVQTPCNQLSDVARAARADCPSVGGSTGGVTGGSKTPPSPKKTPSRTESAEGGDNTLLYAGIASVAVILGGVGYFIYSKRKSGGAL